MATIIKYSDLSIIEVGYHSYSTKAIAIYKTNSARIIRKFIIPKGSKYFINKDKEEYVSNQIIMPPLKVK